MSRVAKDLKIWSKSQFGGAKIQMHIATEVVLRLDIAHETRALSDAEFHLWKMLKLTTSTAKPFDRCSKVVQTRISIVSLLIVVGDIIFMFHFLGHNTSFGEKP